MASTSDPKEERIIERTAAFVPNARHHISYKANVETHSIKYTFNYKIGVNEQTFLLLQSPENSSHKGEITNMINSYISKRILKLVPFKCMSCQSADAVSFGMSGMIINATDIPMIYNPILAPSCEPCQQTVCNSVFDSFPEDIGDMMICTYFPAALVVY